VRCLLLLETVAEDLVYTLDHEQVRRHRRQRGQREPRSGNRTARNLMYRARAVEAVQAPRAGMRGVERQVDVVRERALVRQQYDRAAAVRRERVRADLVDVRARRGDAVA